MSDEDMGEDGAELDSGTDASAVEDADIDDPGSDNDPGIDQFVEPGESLADAAERLGVLTQFTNVQTMGVLTLHYPSRAVSIDIDGDAALRMLALIDGRDSEGFEDRLSPLTSTAARGWLTVDRVQVLAATWTPGRRRELRPRVTVDPIVR